MSGQNQAPIVNKQYSPQVPPSFQQHDEIDLRELFKALWDGKFIIIATTVLFAVGAVFLAFSSQEWWSSSAKVGQPQLQNMSAYHQQVTQFQPVFDMYQDDGAILVSHELNSLVKPHRLLQHFIDQFNSADNKVAFLDSSEEFLKFKRKHSSKDETDRDVYEDWLGKIVAKRENTADSSPYLLSFQSVSQNGSYEHLRDYIIKINQIVQTDLLNNLQAKIDSKRNELIQKKRILELQAKQRLHAEVERAEYALDIAQAAGVTQPIQTSSDNEVFGIDLGAKALSAKVKALKTLKNLSVLEPRIQQVDAKLAILQGLKIDREIQFQAVSFLGNVEKPFAHDKPKRILIIILGVLLGFMFGVAVAMVRFIISQQKS